MAASLSKDLQAVSRGVFTFGTVVPLRSVVPSVMISVPDSVSLTIDLVASIITSVEVRSEVNVIILRNATLRAVLAPFAEFSFLRVVLVLVVAPFEFRNCD